MSRARGGFVILRNSRSGSHAEQDVFIHEKITGEGCNLFTSMTPSIADIFPRNPLPKIKLPSLVWIGRERFLGSVTSRKIFLLRFFAPYTDPKDRMVRTLFYFFFASFLAISGIQSLLAGDIPAEARCFWCQGHPDGSRPGQLVTRVDYLRPSLFSPAEQTTRSAFVHDKCMQINESPWDLDILDIAPEVLEAAGGRLLPNIYTYNALEKLDRLARDHISNIKAFLDETDPSKKKELQMRALATQILVNEQTLALGRGPSAFALRTDFLPGSLMSLGSVAFIVAFNMVDPGTLAQPAYPELIYLTDNSLDWSTVGSIPLLLDPRSPYWITVASTKGLFSTIALGAALNIVTLSYRLAGGFRTEKASRSHFLKQLANEARKAGLNPPKFFSSWRILSWTAAQIRGSEDDLNSVRKCLSRYLSEQ